MTPAESPRRVHLLTAALLVGTFAAGVVTGAGVLRWAASAPSTAPGAATAVHAPPAASPLTTPLPAARLPRELALTPEQEARAREIGERYRPELDQLAKEIRPKIRAVQDRMEGEFLQLLTPEQRAQLARIEERRRNPPRGDGPPARGDQPAARREEPSRSGPPAGGPAPAGQRSSDPGDHPAPPPGARRPPPQEAIDACQHLDLDQLCRFTKGGREHEGSCRPPPGEKGPISCAPDRHLEPPGPRR